MYIYYELADIYMATSKFNFLEFSLHPNSSMLLRIKKIRIAQFPQIIRFYCIILAINQLNHDSELVHH